MSASDSSVNVLGVGTVPVDTSVGTDVTTGNIVYRQRVVIGDDISFGQLANVQNVAPGMAYGGLAVRPIGQDRDIEEIKELLFLILDAQNRLIEILMPTP